MLSAAARGGLGFRQLRVHQCCVHLGNDLAVGHLAANLDKQLPDAGELKRGCIVVNRLGSADEDAVLGAAEIKDKAKRGQGKP